MHHFYRTEKQRTLFMVFYNLIHRAKMSNELERSAERNGEELPQLHPVHCSFSTNSQVIQVTRLT